MLRKAALTVFAVVLAVIVLVCLSSCGESRNPIYPSDADAAEAIYKVFGRCSIVEKGLGFTRCSDGSTIVRKKGPVLDGIPFSSDFPFNSPLPKDYPPVWQVTLANGEVFEVKPPTTEVDGF